MKYGTDVGMSESPRPDSSFRWKVVRAGLAIASLALACSCGGPRIVQLHPVAGDTFGFKLPPPPTPLYGPFDANASAEKRFDGLVASWRARLKASGSPGGAIAVVMDGHLRFAAGVGTREAGRDEPILATTRFRTASISKMIVAATILSLTEHDGVALDRPLTDYVPYFRRGPGYDASAVTLEMLLTHTGGIPDSVYCPDGASLRATIDAHANDPYWAPPGRLFDYSNADYALLAAVIEAKTNRSFEDVVTERILRPAGMSTARYTAGARDTDVARGHVGNEVVWTRPTDCEGSRAAGGVIASVIDFAHFAELLLAGGGTVLSSGSVEAMSRGRAIIQTAPLSKYGYGLIEGSHAGLRTVEHSGEAAGFSTLVRLVPERSFAVIAFVNGTTPPNDVVDAATSAFLGVPEGPRERVPADAARWSDYVGHYADTTGALGEFTVFVDGDALRAERPKGQRPVFVVGNGVFVRDANGRVEYFVTRSGVARRLP
ncbi:MAG TPA: serine hydrolase domain-containing protein [Polyangiaceae bacterium]|jgi:CubicO group peptidase (beta-lactamase class C family)